MRYLIIFTLALLMGTACAQKQSNIPAAVQSKLASIYPNAEEVKWGKEDADFEANFEVDDVEMSVIFDTKGTVIETETEIDNLPASIKASVGNDFSGYDIEETAKIVKNGQTTYEVELEKGETKLDAIYSVEGTLVKKIEKKEQNEEAEQEENEDED
jgi:Putative beta-lactamase-inhibitor-like, PepSY-like